MNDTVIVCGHGRCGSSMVMQMLYCGGVPVNGDWPAFEPPETGIGMSIIRYRDWLAGKATKILEPQLAVGWPSDFLPKIIWMERDHVEQAKSQVKFLRQISNIRVPNSAIRRFAESYSADTRKCFTRFGPARLLRLSFEGVLLEPRVAAETIAGFIGCGDVEAMAAAIVRRSPRCAPGMDMEINLIEQGAPV